MILKKINLKKAAMFGLDARIALAIFGALSIISGAALYSAIKDSKTIALISQLDELSKSYEQYLLDVGSELDIIVDGVYLDIGKLVSDTASGFNGPYTSLEPKTGSPEVLNLKGYSGVFLAEMLSNDWVLEDIAASICVTGELCSVYTGVYGATLEEAKALDLKIDGVDNKLTGNLRYKSTGTIHIFIKKFPVLNQP